MKSCQLQICIFKLLFSLGSKVFIPVYSKLLDSWYRPRVSAQSGIFFHLVLLGCDLSLFEVSYSKFLSIWNCLRRSYGRWTRCLPWQTPESMLEIGSTDSILRQKEKWLELSTSKTQTFSPTLQSSSSGRQRDVRIYFCNLLSCFFFDKEPVITEQDD